MKRRTFVRHSGWAIAASSLWNIPSLRADDRRSGFTHSVASGDPSNDGFVAWTRYVGERSEWAPIRLEVATDPDFARIVEEAVLVARPENDYCVHHGCKGLGANRHYWYRFRTKDGLVSDTGRSRTLPEPGQASTFKIAVVTCSNATSGWFNSYAHLAKRDDVDLIIHLGDYIYESPLTRSDALPGMAELRGIQPYHEAVTLQDYRSRYGSYRDDADLAALHRHIPCIVMMDDHESANNAWYGGAQAHDSELEGSWNDRKTSALKAFHEWLPIRPDPYGRYDIGDLATLLKLETRLLARSQQSDLPSSLERSDLDDWHSTWRQKERTMLGQKQELWLEKQLEQSVRSGIHWQILAQGVIMGERRYPANAAAWLSDGTLVRRDPADPRFEPQRMQQLVKLADNGVPYAQDKWDGYPEARARLYHAARKTGSDLVVFSGDSHAAWAFDLDDGDVPIGVEMSAPSVSSTGFDRRLVGDFSKVQRDFVADNAQLRWCDLSQRGFIEVDIRADAITAQWQFVPSGSTRGHRIVDAHEMAVQRDQRRFTS